MMLRSGKRLAKEVYLYDPIGSDWEGYEINLLDIIEDEEIDIVDNIALDDDIKKMCCVIGKVLTDREREIISLRYGLSNHKEVTQIEIANKFGISKSYVSKIEKQALGKLRECLLEK
jgi:RNA polymerase sporulation-specific sigma factor